MVTRDIGVAHTGQVITLATGMDIMMDITGEAVIYPDPYPGNGSYYGPRGSRTGSSDGYKP